MADLTGKTLGKYQILERLGRGGMADVYRAHQPNVNRFVAIKVMHGHLSDDPQFITRFQREAQIIGNLRHPNIVQVIDFDAHEDEYYMVMEYIQGNSMKDRLRNGAFAVSEAVQIMIKLADAVAYAHAEGMVHRDIKPANILFTKSGNPVLTDFGIARIMADTGLTSSGIAIGTPAYMSPEAGRGEKVDERADIYALGVVFYEMLTGNPPFEADTPYAVIVKHITDPVPPLSRFVKDLPPAVELVVLKAMAKDAINRYQTAVEMRDALTAYVNNPKDTHLAASAQPTYGGRAAAPPREEVIQTVIPTSRDATRPGTKTDSRQSSTRRSPIALIAGVVAIAGVAGVLILTRQPEPTITATNTPTDDGLLIAANATPISTSLAVVSPSPIPVTSTIAAPANPAPTNPLPTSTIAAPSDTAPMSTATSVIVPTDAPDESAGSAVGGGSDIQPTEATASESGGESVGSPSTSDTATESPTEIALADFAALYQQVMQWVDWGMLDEALNATSESYEASPNNYDVAVLHAFVLVQYRSDAEKCETAKNLAKDFTASHPNRPEAYHVLGEYYVGCVSDYTSGVDYFTQGVERGSRFWRTYLFRAEAGRSIDRGADDTLADYTRAIELNPTSAWVWAARGDYHYDQFRYAEAEADYKAAIDVYNDPNLHPRLAAARLQQGNLEGAMAVFDETLNNETDDIEPDGQYYAHAAFVAFYTGDNDKANDYADEALLRNPQAADANYVLALLEWQVGDIEAAREQMEIVITAPDEWTSYGYPFLDWRFDRNKWLDYARIIAFLEGDDPADSSYGLATTVLNWWYRPFLEHAIVLIDAGRYDDARDAIDTAQGTAEWTGAIQVNDVYQEIRATRRLLLKARSNAVRGSSATQIVLNPPMTAADREVFRTGITLEFPEPEAQLAPTNTPAPSNVGAVSDPPAQPPVNSGGSDDSNGDDSGGDDSGGDD